MNSLPRINILTEINHLIYCSYRVGSDTRIYHYLPGYMPRNMHCIIYMMTEFTFLRNISKPIPCVIRRGMRYSLCGHVCTCYWWKITWEISMHYQGRNQIKLIYSLSGSQLQCLSRTGKAGCILLITHTCTSSFACSCVYCDSAGGYNSNTI